MERRERTSMQRIPDEQTPLKIRLPDANAHIAQMSPRRTCAIWDLTIMKVVFVRFRSLSRTLHF